MHVLHCLLHFIMGRVRSCILSISLMLLMYTRSSSAQIGLNWNRLRGELAEGALNTTTGDIQNVLTDILRQFQDFAPDLAGQLPIPGQGEGDVNATEGGEEPPKPAPQFPPGFENLQYVSPICLNHTLTLIGDFQAQKQYAKQMVYSSGSPIPNPSIEFSGLTADYGLFQQCRDVKKEHEGTPFDAEYCILSNYGPEGAQYHSAVCVPASCPDYDLRTIAYTLKGVLDIPVEFHFTCETRPSFTGGDIFVILWCVILGILMLSGTLYHLIKIHTEARKKSNAYEDAPEEACEEDGDHGDDKKVEELEPEDKENQPAAEGTGTDAEREVMNIQESGDDPKKESKSTDGKLGRMLMCFSVIHNFGKIFDISKQKGTLSALNGIRVISMFWIILGHTWQFLGTYRADNPLYMYTQLLPKFWAQTVLHAVFGVDTFFLLSGLLLAYLTLKALKKGDGKINWGLFIFHRFYRITPLYMLILGVWSTLPAHLADGPTVQWIFHGARDTCRRLWWTNFLYINNLHPFPGDLGGQCMGWSWYLANDMQFFIISPIILYLLYKNRKIGFAVIGGILLISTCATIGISYHYGLNIGFNQKPFNNNTADHPTADHLYGKPYHRIPPYLIGIIVGYFLFKLEGKKFDIPRLAAGGMWLLAAGSALGLVYGLYNTTQGYIVPQGTTIFYYAVNTIAWGVAIGWVAFACIKGYGGPVNTILSWPIWTPLARLTFAAYLVHPLVQFVYVWSLPTAVPPTPAFMTYHVIAFIFVSYAVALVFSLAIEAPLMGLEKIWFKRH
ncbi:O-acyltransferase like protein-like [Amphiura filiformis]|uniref:O-acyltransferase like protein-like n=1 Tax=Amphiura filiformis TaxID=82378 RepID=UPI003B214FE6